MNKARNLVIVIAIFLVAIGCGQSQQAAAQAEGAGSSSSAEVENSVVFTCSKVPADGFALSHTEATRHTMTAGDTKYLSIVVMMANYDRQGRSYHPNAEGDDQRRVMLNFSAPAGEALVSGRYSLDAAMGKGHRLSIGIEGGNGSCGLSNGSGFGEITHIDDTTVEGRVSVRDSKGTSIEATFSTPYGVSRY